MSDETRRTDGWDESGTQPETPQPETAQAGAQPGSAAADAAGEGAVRPVGFCQDCGKPLTAETLRAVGKGVFCEPCLEMRLRQGPVGGYAAGPAQGSGPFQGYAGAQNAGYTTVPPPVAGVAGEPSPALAGFLGLIPGVGAMYNGQFAKGVVHLIIFVILVSMANNVSGIFWIFVWGWIFYQSFEAYHTARARLEGLPLPNAFGFNDIGDRMGFGKSWGPVAGGKAEQPPVGAAPTPPAGAATTSPAGSAPTPPMGASAPPWAAPPAAGRDWVGYVPPPAFAQAGTAQQTAAREQASYGAGYAAGSYAVGSYGTRAGQAGVDARYAPPEYTSSGYVSSGYAETFTGHVSPGSPGPNPYGYAAGPYGVPAALPERRFPMGALWLIVLGVLILLANVVPDWRIGGRWWPTILLAGFAVWLLTRRLVAGGRVACIVRWPAILMVLAVLFALHAAYLVVTFGTICAVLLIAFGALLLVERTLGTSAAYSGAAVYGVASSGPAAARPVVEGDPARAAFTEAATPASEPPVGSGGDDAKGGQ